MLFKSLCNLLFPFDHIVWVFGGCSSAGQRAGGAGRASRAGRHGAQCCRLGWRGHSGTEKCEPVSNRVCHGWGTYRMAEGSLVAPGTAVLNVSDSGSCHQNRSLSSEVIAPATSAVLGAIRSSVGLDGLSAWLRVSAKPRFTEQLSINW